MNAQRAVAFAERLAQIAASGGGPSALTAHLAEETGKSVLLEDAGWQRIAAAGGDEMPASARETVEGGAPGRAMRLVAGDAHVGWLSVFGNGIDASVRTATRDLDLLMRLASAAIAAELARALPGDHSSRPRAFWERLIGRVYHDAAAARDDAAAHGIALAPAYVAIALELEAGEGASLSDREVLRAAAAAVLGGVDAGHGFFERGAALAILVPAAREIDASKARTAAILLPKSIAKQKPGLRFAGGVGTVEAPLALHASVETAEAALAIGRRAFGQGRVVAYDELGAYPLLYQGADVHRLQTFARRILEPLRLYDRKHQTELERTLRLFFAVGQNVKTAAAQLNVHRHTVFYRLRQIGEICGCSLESPHDQLTLRLAVAIDALHSS